MNKEITNTQTQIDTLIDKIINKVIKEYDIFKKDMLLKTSEFLFDNAYKISSYTDLLYYFENDGFAGRITGYFEYASKNKDDIQKLQTFSEKNILEELYEEHFNYESLYFTLWEDIDTLIESVIFEVN